MKINILWNYQISTVVCNWITKKKKIKIDYIETVHVVNFPALLRFYKSCSRLLRRLQRKSQTDSPPPPDRRCTDKIRNSVGKDVTIKKPEQDFGGQIVRGRKIKTRIIVKPPERSKSHCANEFDRSFFFFFFYRYAIYHHIVRIKYL